MKDKVKKLTGVVVATVLCAATFAGCGNYYSAKKVSGDDIFQGTVESNGGFVVEKGNYVYFINGSESYTASNTYGDAVKGSLMRISKANLTAGAYDKAEIVVPMLFVAQNFDAGIYIYGDYVYYATPTTEKDLNGDVQNDWISFKRAKLDGSEVMKKYYFRSSSNDIDYRYVEMGGVVYCLYVEDSVLYSYNTSTGDNTVLVSGAESDFVFDTSDATNPVVYYTMSVTENEDTDHSTSVDYTQLYAVSADAVMTSVSASEGKYSFKGSLGGNTYENSYTFDADYLKENLDDFDASDYTTYPYVNLGKLVLDGKGSLATYSLTQFSNDADATSTTVSGYTYSIQSYQNNGLYFTREDVGDSSDGENSKLRYLADATWQADGWKTIADNANSNINIVALNTTNASSSALYYIDNGTHYYIYTSDSKIYRVKAAADGKEAESVCMVPSASSITLWKTEGNYLYYYGSGTNGNNLSRVNYLGSKDDYNPLLVDGEYVSAQILDIDWNSSWYKPEFVANRLLYSNAQSFGSTSYNYIYVVSLAGSGKDGYMTAAELEAYNDKYDEVMDYIDDLSDSDLQTLFKYYFRTGSKVYFEDALTESKEAGYNDYHLYSEYTIKEFRAYATQTKSENREANDYSKLFYDATGKYYGVETYFINFIGQLDEDDADEIEEAWQNQITTIEEEEDTGWATWQKVLLGIGIGVGVLLIAAVVVIIILVQKKKAKAEADKEATAIRMPHIDTTDDKSIDVYADDTAESTETTEATEATEETEATEATEATETTEAATEETAETVETAETAETAETEETATETAQGDTPSENEETKE
jgi:hypothetical protein